MMGVVIQKPWSKCIAHQAVKKYLLHKLNVNNGGHDATLLEVMEIYLSPMISIFSFASERHAFVQVQPKNVVIQWTC